jgi:hypothetical protein
MLGLTAPESVLTPSEYVFRARADVPMTSPMTFLISYPGRLSIVTASMRRPHADMAGQDPPVAPKPPWRWAGCAPVGSPREAGGSTPPPRKAGRSMSLAVATTQRSAP